MPSDEVDAEVREKIREAAAAGRINLGEREGEALSRISTSPDFTVTESWIRGGALCVAWSTVSAGFGEINIFVKDDKLMIENEGMSKDFIKQVLCKLVDSAELV